MLKWREGVPPLLSDYLTTIPPPSFPLTVIAVFWLLSRCHAETTTTAPLCQSISLPEECLFNSGMLWQGETQCLVSQLNSLGAYCYYLSARQALSRVISDCLHFPDWWHTLAMCLNGLRHFFSHKACYLPESYKESVGVVVVGKLTFLHLCASCIYYMISFIEMFVI